MSELQSLLASDAGSVLLTLYHSGCAQLLVNMAVRSMMRLNLLMPSGLAQATFFDLTSSSSSTPSSSSSSSSSQAQEFPTLSSATPAFVAHVAQMLEGYYISACPTRVVMDLLLVNAVFKPMVKLCVNSDEGIKT